MSLLHGGTCSGKDPNQITLHYLKVNTVIFSLTKLKFNVGYFMVHCNSIKSFSLNNHGVRINETKHVVQTRIWDGSNLVNIFHIKFPTFKTTSTKILVSKSNE